MRRANVHGFCDQEVQYGTWCYLNANGPIPLLYLPEAPQDVRINLLVEDRQIRLHTAGIGIVAGLFLVVGLVGFILTFRNNAIYRVYFGKETSARVQ